MNENQLCPIWGTSTLRAGGEYVIDEAALRKLEDCDDQDNRVKARLTSWLVEQRRLGNPRPRITEKTVMDAKQSRDLTVHERADRLLQCIEEAVLQIGQRVSFRSEHFYPSMEPSPDYLNNVKMLAWSESVEQEELRYLLKYLDSQKWIRYNDSSETCVLNVEGYARLAYLKETDTESSQAFVAMWFDESTDNAWEQGIKPGVEKAGYEPIRIDQKEHSNKIDDEIVAEIKRSRFVVADFTQGNDGASGGVYYEAGFAHGLDIPVIYTCQRDMLDKIHFDTRQYSHIPWDNTSEGLEKFRQDLATRISAVIGDGPHKGDNA